MSNSTDESQGADATPLTVLDLPQVYTKPSFAILLSTLEFLTAQPASFTANRGFNTSSVKLVDENGLPAYLTRIISSPLTWIAYEDRERIWEAASARLAERSGRSGMSGMTRAFTIRVGHSRSIVNGAMGKQDEMDGKQKEAIDIKIHEPSLTGDNLGHKTWAASYALAQQLDNLLPVYYPLLISTPPSRPDSQPPIHILELGAGTGLTGLSAAALFPQTARLHMTDLPEIVRNLQSNVELNAHTLSRCQEPPKVSVLDWNTLPSFNPPNADRFPTSPSSTRLSPYGHEAGLGKYHVIVAADALYSPSHPTWLANAIATHLDGLGKAFISLPFRDMGKRDYHALMREAMAGCGLALVQEEVVSGFDDWDGGRMEVKCWISVWGWNPDEGA